MTDQPISREEFELLKAELKINTEVTLEVREIVVAFRVVARVAKWCTAIAIAITAFWSAWDHTTKHLGRTL